jgi:hypothetical protein
MDFAKANLMEFVRAGNADVARWGLLRGRQSNLNRVFPVQKRNDDGDSLLAPASNIAPKRR